MSYVCELCGKECEYDEGTIYDNETFVCFECEDEFETQQTIISQIDRGTF